MDKAVKVLLVPIKFKFYMFCRSDTPVDDIACGLHDRGSSPEKPSSSLDRVGINSRHKIMSPVLKPVRDS